MSQATLDSKLLAAVLKRYGLRERARRLKV
jgi:hypothetical protein